MDDEDEPLAQWAARREGRLRKPGERKAITLAAGPQRAAHVNPEAPRLVLEWDGFAWQVLMTVPNFAAAYEALHPHLKKAAPAAQPEATEPRRNPLGPGTGRHRRPRD
ncbi:DUF6087 family protein [Streptomyces sp. NPDC056401]|uniref:DUF6087 family protein n=1 Tax=Streptomyces sp. NPDC056401 TaxID=3345809 RepID=UPI0035D71FAD